MNFLIRTLTDGSLSSTTERNYPRQSLLGSYNSESHSAFEQKIQSSVSNDLPRNI